MYDRDFFLWTQQTAAALRAGRLEQADLEHVAEEIEDLGKRDRREVESRLIVLLVHLIKWCAQPERRGPSWENTIDEQRRELRLVLRDSPSLRRYAGENLAAVYTEACRQARKEMRQPDPQVPEPCPWTLDQVLDPDFLRF